MDFVGIGAARCATTWLARCLGEHPSIHLPRRKELHYFDNDFLFEPALRRLRRAFAGARPGQLRGEITPRYIISPPALERIARHCPGVRILVSLRDPVERAFSQFLYLRYNLKREPLREFHEAIGGPLRDEYIGRSRYAGPLQTVLGLFGSDRVHVVLYDDVAARPHEVLRGLYGFLGVDPGFVPPSAARHVNRSRERRAAPPDWWAALLRHFALGRTRTARLLRPGLRPVLRSINRLIDLAAGGRPGPAPAPLDGDARRRLFERYFKDDVERTEKILGRDLSAWRPAGPPEGSSRVAA